MNKLTLGVISCAVGFAGIIILIQTIGWLGSLGMVLLLSSRTLDHFIFRHYEAKNFS